MNSVENLPELPKNWRWVKLGEISKTTSGGTPSRKKTEYYNGNIPWLKSGELNDGYIYSSEEKITEDALNNSSAKIFPINTLLVALYGATVGKTGILGIQAATNQAICAIFPEENSFLQEFMKYFVIQKKKDLLKERYGGAQPNISQNILREMLVPLPSIDIQKQIILKIDELFSQLDSGLASLQRTKLLLNQYRLAVLKAAMEGELTKEWREKHQHELEPASVLLEHILLERRQKWEEEQLAKFQAQGKIPKDDSWKKKYKEPEETEISIDQEIPDSWIHASIDQLFEISGGGTPSTKEPKYWNGQIAWLTPTDVTSSNSLSLQESSRYITELGLKNSSARIIPKKSVLMTSRATIGEVVINEIPMATNQGFINIQIIQDHILNKFVAFWIQAIRKLLIDNASGTTFKEISKRVFRTFGFPLAPYNEQQKIVEELEKSLSIIKRNNEDMNIQFSKIEQLKQSILKTAFEGKLIQDNSLIETISNQNKIEEGEIRKLKQIKRL